MSEIMKTIEDAIHQINTYRNPDISEAREHINEILTAAGLGTTGSDNINSISISGVGDKRKVYISTNYSVRSCEQSDDFEFPVSLLEASNPVEAATQWGIEQSIEELKYETARAKRTFESSSAELAAKEKELSDFLTAKLMLQPDSPKI